MIKTIEEACAANVAQARGIVRHVDKTGAAPAARWPSAAKIRRVQRSRRKPDEVTAAALKFLNTPGVE